MSLCLYKILHTLLGKRANRHLLLYQNELPNFQGFLLHSSGRTCSPYRTCQSQINLQEMESSKVVLDMFYDNAIEVFVSFSSDIFSQFIFKLSRELSKTIDTFLNQLLQFIFSKVRVQSKTKSKISLPVTTL